MKNEKDTRISDGLKALFIVVGAVVTIGSILAVLYTLFKKYFKITFEPASYDDCDCFGGDCDNCEPVCYFGDDDEIEDELAE